MAEEPQALSLGMIQVRTNAQLIKEEENNARMEAEARQKRPEVLTLVGWTQKCWQAAKTAKIKIEARMLRALRMRNSEYEPDKLVDIQKYGGSQVYMSLPDEKCSSLESWLEDILFVPGQEPWTTDTTPMPDISPTIKMQIAQQVTQEATLLLRTGQQLTKEMIQQRLEQLQEMAEEIAQEKARKIEAKVEMQIKDALVESGWKDALKEAVQDLATHPAGFIAGPIYRKKPSLTWDQTGRAVVADAIKAEWEWVSAFDIYPSPHSTRIETGWLFRRHRLTRDYLYSLIGTEGFDDDVIRHVLYEHGTGGLADWLAISGDTERKRLENRDQDLWDPDTRIDALQFWCSVPGLMLLQAGMDPQKIPDPVAEYHAEIWMIGNYLIKCTLNDSPLGKVPIYKASFREVAGSFWGKGPCDVIFDKVDVANASARALVNNMAIASGPQVGVDVSKNPGGHDYRSIYPWKVWQFDMEQAEGSRPPIWFFQPNALTQELLGVYDKFSQEIDYQLGIPRFATGANERGGMAGTATGASMLQGNAMKGIKRVVANIDKGWIVPSINRMREDLLLYRPTKEMLMCDIRLVATGATSMVAKEQQQVRRNEFLQILLHPYVMQTAGPEPMLEVLRAVANGVDIDLSRAIPTREQMIQAQAVQQQQIGNANQPPKGRAVNGAGDVANGRDVALN